jgi:peptidoglycan/LPS O-acetylase OafA/YrhL
VLLAVSASPGSALQRILTTRILTRLGAIAYFTYLFHLPITEACRRIAASHVAIPSVFTSACAYTIGIAVTLALAMLSWRFFEKPLIAVGRRFSY